MNWWIRAYPFQIKQTPQLTQLAKRWRWTVTYGGFVGCEHNTLICTSYGSNIPAGQILHRLRVHRRLTSTLDSINETNGLALESVDREKPSFYWKVVTNDSLPSFVPKSRAHHSHRRPSRRWSRHRSSPDPCSGNRTSSSFLVPFRFSCRCDPIVRNQRNRTLKFERRSSWVR